MNTLIYGTRKQGKSTLALALGITEHPRVVIFDPNDQFPLIVSIPVCDLEEWCDSHNGSGYQLIRVGPLDTDEAQDTFSVFSEVLYTERDITVVVDEAHMFQGGNSINEYLDRWNRRSS